MCVAMVTVPGRLVTTQPAVGKIKTHRDTHKKREREKQKKPAKMKPIRTTNAMKSKCKLRLV